MADYFKTTGKKLDRDRAVEILMPAFDKNKDAAKAAFDEFAREQKQAADLKTQQERDDRQKAAEQTRHAERVSKEQMQKERAEAPIREAEARRTALLEGRQAERAKQMRNNPLEVAARDADNSQGPEHLVTASQASSIPEHLVTASQAPLPGGRVTDRNAFLPGTYDRIFVAAKGNMSQKQEDVKKLYNRIGQEAAVQVLYPGAAHPSADLMGNELARQVEAAKLLPATQRRSAAVKLYNEFIDKAEPEIALTPAEKAEYQKQFAANVEFDRQLTEPQRTQDAQPRTPPSSGRRRSANPGPLGVEMEVNPAQRQPQQQTKDDRVKVDLVDHKVKLPDKVVTSRGEALRSTADRVASASRVQGLDVDQQRQVVVRVYQEAAVEMIYPGSKQPSADLRGDRLQEVVDQHKQTQKPNDRRIQAVREFNALMDNPSIKIPAQDKEKAKRQFALNVALDHVLSGQSREQQGLSPQDYRDPAKWQEMKKGVDQKLLSEILGLEPSLVENRLKNSENIAEFCKDLQVAADRGIGLQLPILNAPKVETPQVTGQNVEEGLKRAMSEAATFEETDIFGSKTIHTLGPKTPTPQQPDFGEFSSWKQVSPASPAPESAPVKSPPSPSTSRAADEELLREMLIPEKLSGANIADVAVKAATSMEFTHDAKAHKTTMAVSPEFKEIADVTFAYTTNTADRSETTVTVNKVAASLGASPMLKDTGRIFKDAASPAAQRAARVSFATQVIDYASGGTPEPEAKAKLADLALQQVEALVTEQAKGGDWKKSCKSEEVIGILQACGVKADKEMIRSLRHDSQNLGDFTNNLAVITGNQLGLKHEQTQGLQTQCTTRQDKRDTPPPPLTEAQQAAALESRWDPKRQKYDFGPASRTSTAPNPKRAAAAGIRGALEGTAVAPPPPPPTVKGIRGPSQQK